LLEGIGRDLVMLAWTVAVVVAVLVALLVALYIWALMRAREAEGREASKDREGAPPRGDLP
jgi:membrane protein implicated in regulation of membrane protease activity